MSAYFFDSSALAKLYHNETGSAWIRETVRESGHRILISRLTVVEIQSVFAVKVRSDAISLEEAATLRRGFLSDIRDGAFEVLALALHHYRRAEQLIESYGFRHRLRTLDALQLSVATELPKACWTTSWLRTNRCAKWQCRKAFPLSIRRLHR